MKGYALFIWNEDGIDMYLELVGFILARSEESAKWSAKIAKIKFDVIHEMQTIDADSTIFKSNP